MKKIIFPILFMILITSVLGVNISDCTTLNSADTTYDLTADIVNKVGAYANGCMEVTATNVTLNCHGYMIDGMRNITTGSTNEIGLKTIGNYTTIRDCIFSDWIIGIQFVDSDGHEVHNNTIFNITSNAGNTGGYSIGGGVGSKAYGMYLSNVEYMNAINNTIYNLQGGTGGLGGTGGAGGHGGDTYAIYISNSAESNYFANNNISDVRGGAGGQPSVWEGKYAPTGDVGLSVAFMLAGTPDNIITPLSSNSPDDSKLNTIDGSPILYFYQEDNLTIEGYTVETEHNTTPVTIGTLFGSGILLYTVSNSTIANNTISGFGSTGNSDTLSSGIALYYGCQNNTVVDNIIFNITGGTGSRGGGYTGGDEGGTGTGIYISTSINNELYGNDITYITGGTGGIGGKLATCSGAGGVGSAMYLEDAYYGNVIHSNTFDDIIGGVGGKWEDSLNGIHEKGADQTPYAIWIDSGSYNNTFLPLIGNVPDITKYNFIGTNPIVYFYDKQNIAIGGHTIDSSVAPFLLGDEGNTRTAGIVAIKVTNSTINQNFVRGFNGFSGYTGKAQYTSGQKGHEACGIYTANSDGTTIINNRVISITGGTGGTSGKNSGGGAGGDGRGICDDDSFDLNVTNNIILNMIGGVRGDEGYDGSFGVVGDGFSLWFDNSNNIELSSNILEDSDGSNKYAIYMNQMSDGIVYNNLINASDEVDLFETFPGVIATWNIMDGGNYWTNEFGTGYSDNCTNVDAFPYWCDNPYTVAYNCTNVDAFPLWCDVTFDPLGYQYDLIPLTIPPNITIDTQCNDGIDNDFDGDIDVSDTKCSSPSGLSEFDITFIYECGDGLDNDGDGFTDYPIDPSCTSYSDDNESPMDYVACGDSIDNDGDGFIDFPFDPSCSSLIDTSEHPFDTPQCNDSIDNDLDGFVDLDDPSCSNSSDASEFPVDSSIQEEDDCFVEENCILYDSIPYNDNPALHGWWGTLVESTANYFYRGGYSLFLDAYDEDTDTVYSLLAKKNITNPNNYNNVDGTIVMSFVDLGGFPEGEYNSPVYIYFLDYDGDIVGSLRLNFSDHSTVPPLTADVYVSDYDTYVYVDTVVFSQIDDYLIWFYFDFDQLNNEYSFEIDDYDAGRKSSGTYDMYSHENIYSVGFQHSLTSTYADVLVQVVELIGDDEVSTVCTTPESPYYLEEYFNGFINLCDWSTSHNIYANGELHLTQSIPFYYAQKSMFGTIDDDNTRYATMQFDLKIVNITTGNTLPFRVYDEESTNFLTAFFDSSQGLYYDDDGTGTLAQSNIPLNEWFRYKFIIDLRDDTFDIVFNESTIVSNAGFTDAFYNIETIEYIKFSSSTAEYYLDNLVVYGSGETGEPQTPDIDVPTDVVDDTKSFCNLFSSETSYCTTDDDCDSGDCLPNGKCNSFDMTYCDENGHKRGNKCMVAGVMSCTLESTADLILDNFLLFLVLLILIIGVVYFVLTLK